MRYAIVESGGKQYRAVEGGTLDVDRLPVEAGAKLDLPVLLISDGDEVLVGAPTVSGILVKATVLAHVKGPKVLSFKYRPKKRIRVRGGHRHQYTRLMVDFIGKEGEERKVEKAPKAKKAAEVEAVAAVEEVAEKPAKKPAAKKATTEKKPAAAKTTEKKPAAKKATAEKKPAAKKTSSEKKK
ncbi:MAG: 50S ribosomal protein L21 [Chloroflexi bacterium]|nr:50S ribosomal protein L21 [Chloroflexota bacterium]